jgi:hypothetical protein
MSAPKLTDGEIAELLRRAGLDPADWDLPEILRQTNAWISDCHVELTAPEVATWSPKLQAEHYAEFGSLAAVDFIEQCVIEAGPETAPWEELAARADAGDFETWPPVWQAEKPSHRRPL